ncbi:hypothetical protein STEG23_003430 [Scotinomys teguina]
MVWDQIMKKKMRAKALTDHDTKDSVDHRGLWPKSMDSLLSWKGHDHQRQDKALIKSKSFSDVDCAGLSETASSEVDDNTHTLNSSTPLHEAGSLLKDLVEFSYKDD